MKRVLITGAAGFIGSSIAIKLKDEGLKLILVDNLSKGRKENLNELANELIIGDLSDEIMNQWGQKTIEVLPGTPGDQFEIYSTNSPLENVLGRPTIKIYEGLRLWKKEIESKY